jgi:hypothetical protein
MIVMYLTVPLTFVLPNTLDILDFTYNVPPRSAASVVGLGREVKIFLSLLISFNRKTRLPKSFFKKVIGMTPSV